MISKIKEFLLKCNKYGLVKIKKEPFWKDCIKITEDIRNIDKPQEIVYIILNDIKEKQRCPYCQKELKFCSIKYGYYKTCGEKDCYRKNL